MSIESASTGTIPDVPIPPANEEVERLECLIDDLRAEKPVRDDRFDRFLHLRWRVPSAVHWTPVDVCRKAALLLCPGPSERVLDVGSGPGKFCVVGSLVTSGTFVGVEQREHLVRQAESLARQVGSNRAKFVFGNAFDIDWVQYQGLYFFNPFAELQFPDHQRIDDYISFDPVRHQQYVTTTAARLRSMPVGTRVVIYHGLGCEMPGSYSLLSSEWVRDGKLQLWRQAGDFSVAKGDATMAI